ncbi:hypothetical protein Tco_0929643 [Tanacetum coccineum]
MSTLVFVDLNIFTQADGAQSSRVPVPFPEDPYEAIKQAYIVETDTESEPFEDHVETRHLKDSDTSAVRSTSSNSTAPLSPDHPLTHTSPTLVPLLRRTARIAVCVPPTMSPSLSASITEVAAMSDSTFRKRFRSSYESSASSSSPDLPSRKLSRGTSELVEDEEEEDEDEELEESSNSDSESEVAKDEGPIVEDEGPAAEDEGPAVGDEGLAAGDEGPGMRVESLGLGKDEAVPEGQQRASPVMKTTICQGSRSVPEPERPERVSALRHPTLTTWIDPEDGRTYIDVPAYPPPAPPDQTPPSPEWSSSSLPISPVPSTVPSPISSPMIPLTVPSPIASPATAEAEGFFTKLGAQVEMQGRLIHDHTVRLGELSPALFERYDRDIGELFTMSGAIAEERSTQLDLAKIVASMGRGQDPRGDV